jgi:hypothetical protein
MGDPASAKIRNPELADLIDELLIVPEYRLPEMTTICTGERVVVVVVVVTTLLCCPQLMIIKERDRARHRIIPAISIFFMVSSSF